MASSKEELVEKVLEQGQRLRNAMIKSILDNDPFNTDVLTNKPTSLANSKQTGPTQHELKSYLTVVDKDKVFAYLRGDPLSPSDEALVLDTIRTLSTDNTLSTICNCEICKAYESENLSCMVKHAPVLDSNKENEKPIVPLVRLHANRGPKELAQEATASIQNSYRSRAGECLKYVDSLKIFVHSFALNPTGTKKVCASFSSCKFSASGSCSFFVEYSMPELMRRVDSKRCSKVDTGMYSGVTRFCSKQLHSEAVDFKQISLHDIANLDKLNLQDVNIKFQISWRTFKQKQSNVLGYAIFNMGCLTITKYLTCSQELVVSDDKNIAMGVLKLSLQFGCGRLYFGKEFVEGLFSNKSNDILPNYTNWDGNDSDFNKHNQPKVKARKPPEVDRKPSISYKIDRKIIGKDTKANRTSTKDFAEFPAQNSNFSRGISNRSSYDNAGPQKVLQNPNDRHLLYGFIYVSEVQYLLEPVNSYLICNPFCSSDKLYSRVVYCSSKPLFDFSQKFPILYEENYILNLRENYMVLEFWKKSADEKDVLFAITKLSLHPFYVTYRNSTITGHLLKSQLPVVSTDWWEPIRTPVDGEVCGQVKVLLALGSESQIKQLETERGLRDHIVTAKSLPILNSVCSTARPKNEVAKQPNNFSTKRLNKPKERDNNCNKPPDVKQITTKSIDAAVQSDLAMEDQQQPEKSASELMLQSLLSQLVVQQQKVYTTENGTNTDRLAEVLPIAKVSFDDGRVASEELNKYKNETNAQLKKTSELLDSLQQALSHDGLAAPQPLLSTTGKREAGMFRAHVMIEEALHLPSRKKCRSKKTKRRNVAYENVLPSTYVTFEARGEADLKITPIVQKNTSPKWGFQCDVLLPSDFLTNAQKRLIFKVWRKSFGNSVHSNQQTDIILGFAAVDLTVLLAGLPSVQGWFNIVDFSSKCNGQIKINVTPLENLTKFNQQIPQKPSTPDIPPSLKRGTSDLDEPGETLNGALRRKFEELDEITQRLRSRLADVVSKDDSDASNDEVADEFEDDINSLCIEEDYDMIDLEHAVPTNDCNKVEEIGLLQFYNNGLGLSGGATISENLGCSEGFLKLDTFASNSNENSAALLKDSVLIQKPVPDTSITALDRQLIDGKQRIDTLLEKLSLIGENGVGAQNPFGSRYVSGCSINQNATVQASGNNYHGVNWDQSLSVTSLLGEVGTSSSSESSLMTQLSEFRLAPDGAGNSVDDKISKRSIS